MSASAESLQQCQRLVIKIGSSSLTRSDGGLDLNRIDQVAAAVAALRGQGREVVVVSSGAIAAALTPLGLSARPTDLATAQAAAAVGQGLLMARWAAAFASHHGQVAQVLLTAHDLIRREHYTNARRALARLLDLGVVPIVNENDAVATAQIRFGDNDRLAALLTHLVRADGLLLLTDVDALYDAPPSQSGARRITRVDSALDLSGITVTGRGSLVGTGGMVTKLAAARMATSTGTPVLLTSADNLVPALAGEKIGTWFSVTGSRQSARRTWMAYAAESAGKIFVDEGAESALCQRGSSLLAAGILQLTGDFEAGDVVELVGPKGRIFARGVVAFSTAEVGQIIGKTTSQIAAQTQFQARPVVHRDYLVLV